MLDKPDLSIYAESANLATVATSGDYDDLIDKPDLSIYAQSANLATVATSGDYDDLIDKPDLSIYAESANLATVATTGDYDDLLNKPTIPVTDVEVNGVSVLSGTVAEVSVPTNYVTTDTTQTITGAKTFTNADGSSEPLTVSYHENDTHGIKLIDLDSDNFTTTIDTISIRRGDKSLLFPNKTGILAVTSDIPTAGNDIVINNNVISTIYGGVPGTSSSYTTDEFTNIALTYAATNFMESNDSTFVNAIYAFDKTFLANLPSGAFPVPLTISYAFSLVDLNDNVRKVVESRTSVDGYSDNSQDYLNFTSGYFFRTFFYRTASSTVRVGFYNPGTGVNMSCNDLITYLNSRDSANYDLSSMQLDYFIAGANATIPGTPINDEYINYPITDVTVNGKSALNGKIANLSYPEKFLGSDDISVTYHYYGNDKRDSKYVSIYGGTCTPNSTFTYIIDNTSSDPNIVTNSVQCPRRTSRYYNIDNTTDTAKINTLLEPFKDAPIGTRAKIVANIVDNNGNTLLSSSSGTYGFILAKIDATSYEILTEDKTTNNSAVSQLYYRTAGNC